MEREHPNFIDREKEKIRVSLPPEDIEKQLKEQQAREFKLVKKLSKDLKPGVFDEGIKEEDDEELSEDESSLKWRNAA
jgi:hypothetical protein